MTNVRNTRIASTAAVAAAALLLAACASTPVEEPKPAPVVTATPTPAPAPAPVARPAPAPAPAQIDPLNDPNSPLAKRSVYFDFDQFVVKSEYLTTVTAHGNYLAGNKARRVTIEGNADERGSREYNLALGQKRADAVKSRLTVLGVGDAQVETISFGKEKPRATGHDEKAWAENRRADIVYR